MAEKLPAYATPDQIPAVVDNLTSDSTTAALSAAQGKALNSSLTSLSGQIANDLSEYNISFNTNYISNNRTSVVHVGNRLIVAGTFVTGTLAIPTATTFGLIVKGSSTHVTISAGTAVVYLIQSNDFTTPYYLQVNSDGTLQPVVNALKASTWFSFVIILDLA